jgi:tetratricopeptide (TPR) repeat protein
MKIADPWLKLAGAYAANGRKAEASQSFRTALEGADRSKDWPPIFELAAVHDGLLAALLERQPDEPKLQWELARKLVARGKQHLAEKRPASARADWETSRAIFARVRAKHPEPRWAVLAPSMMASADGATLTRLFDDSILVGGKNPPTDTYTVSFRDLPARIHALRLEVLPHESLPSSGPGRAANGRFVLTTIKAHSDRPAKRVVSRIANLARAWDDFCSGEDARPFHAIDADDITGWSPGEAGKPHFAVFELAEPLAVTDGTVLRVTLEFKHFTWSPLGRFRLSAAIDPETVRAAQIRANLPDAEAIDLEVALGKLYAQRGLTEEAIASFAAALRMATDRTSKARIFAEAARLHGVLEKWVPHLAASAANPEDSTLSLHVAVLQAWFGREKELAVTRQRILAFAKGSNEAATAARAARACGILPSPDKAQLEAALALGRKAVELGKGGEMNLLALGMAEYRSGNFAAADEALLAAAKAGPKNPHTTGISSFYRAMSLFRQGKKDEARKLATAAAAKSKPLPKDEKNPLVGDAGPDDLVLWLAHKEAKAVIEFDAPPPPKGKDEK